MNWPQVLAVIAVSYLVGAIYLLWWTQRQKRRMWKEFQFSIQLLQQQMIQNREPILYQDMEHSEHEKLLN